MDLQGYKDEILLKLGGNYVNVELLDNGGLDKIIQAAFREIQRYINVPKLATLPYAPCIDLSKCKVSSISQVYRATPIGTGNTTQDSGSLPDAIFLSMNNMSGSMLNSSMMSNLASFYTWKQITNTVSTDLAFYFDETKKYLYINAPSPKPDKVTIGYIPKYDDVGEIDNPFWEDMLLRLALALSKEALGRIRGKYKLNNALYDLDAEQLLSEGREELAAIREYLQTNSDLVYPID